MYSKPLLFDKYVTLYGICIAIGIAICILLLRFFGKKSKTDSKFMDFVEINGYVAILIGFLFASLFQSFYNYIETGKFELFNGGITFIGGLIGGAGSFIIVYLIMRNRLSGKIIDILPFAPICIVIAHAFGRVGCFFAGCCGGRVALPTDAFYFLSVTFPNDSMPTYPTQLFEAAFLFALFGVLMFLYLKYNFKYGFVIYLGAYGIWRFLIEYVRGDERGEFIGSITPSQFWSILMVILAIPLFIFIKYLIKNRKENI